MVGTRGVPARYGGFETCVEEVGSRLAALGHQVRVYCRTDDASEALSSYKGMSLVHRGAMRRRSLETLSHTGLSVAHLAAHRTDVAIVFNAANAPWLPVLRVAGIPIATHVDGLEWQRGKWGTLGRNYYRLAERAAVRWSDALIADAKGIADYYRDKYSASTTLISYGAPQVSPANDRLSELGLTADGFYLVVARFEPENNIEMIVDGYCRSTSTRPLVVVGSAPYADKYTQGLHDLADDRVRFLGGIWDQQLLDQLYRNAFTYLHGHSVGGTNPSLLRALGAGTATAAFDVCFNREVLEDAGRYFGDAARVAELIEESESDPGEIGILSKMAAERSKLYDWDDVAERYEDLCHELNATGSRPYPAEAALTAAPAHELMQR